jgi:CopG family nickel-responsive transcriptional regulator
MERFTISLESKLAEEFDRWILERGYSNRSEAVRDLLRAELGRTSMAKSASTQCVACLSYVYNHHERDLAERLTGMQHEHHDLAISAMHAHLDHDHCLETVLLKGPTAEVQRFADAVCAERGVHHGKVNVIGVETHHAHSHATPGRGRSRGAGATHVHVKPEY